MEFYNLIHLIFILVDAIGDKVEVLKKALWKTEYFYLNVFQCTMQSH